MLEARLAGQRVRVRWEGEPMGGRYSRALDSHWFRADAAVGLMMIWDNCLVAVFTNGVTDSGFYNATIEINAHNVMTISNTDVWCTGIPLQCVDIVAI